MSGGKVFRAVAPAVMLAVAALCGCSGRQTGQEGTGMPDSVAEMRAEITDEAWEWADSVMTGMSDSEMVGQLFMPAMYARARDYDLSRLMEYVSGDKVGGIVLLKGDLTSVAMIADTLRKSAGPGVFLAIDAENGLRMRLADAPEFPWSREMGRLTDDQLLYEFGREIARECRAVGISMVLGPVMDVVPGDGSHGIMARRSLGSDPRRVADLALAYARGLEDGNVISVAKHFPGHGSASADSHKSLGMIPGDAERLDSVDLYPFRRYSEELLSGVMVGHLSATALDTVRRPAVVSPVVMQDVLRSRLGFGGLVLTDALNMEGALGVTAWEAVAAGADMVIAPTDTRREISLALEALKDGRLARATLENRVRRILFYKYLAGLPGAGGIDVEDAVREVGHGASALRDSIRSTLSQKRPLSRYE